MRTALPPRLVEDSLEETGREKLLLAADQLQGPETAAGVRGQR